MITKTTKTQNLTKTKRHVMTDVVQLNVSWKTERDGITHTIVRDESDSNDSNIQTQMV